MIKPLGDRVLVKPAAIEDSTASGIIIKRSDKEKQDTGTVIAVGDGQEIAKYGLKDGDTVLYQKFGPIYFTRERQEYAVVYIDEIVGVDR